MSGWPPPLLAEQPRSTRIVLAVVIPAIFGVVTGIFLGVSSGIYGALSLLAAVAGVLAGFDHLGAPAGAKRGLLGGALFGVGILLAHETSGATATFELPEPAIVLAMITAVIGSALGALGGWLRGRRPAPAGRD